MSNEKKSVAILLFEDVELLDFAGPYEVFTSVRTPPDRTEELMSVFTIAESSAPLKCRAGLIVQPDYALDTAPHFDILLIPGGRGTRAAIKRQSLIDWVAAQNEKVEYMTSVCTGSFLLAQAGLLQDVPTTTHWASVEWMREHYPGVEVRDNTRWVDNGHIIGSAGVSAGIDMALHLVERIYGEEIAHQTARGMEYEYWPVHD